MLPGGGDLDAHATPDDDGQHLTAATDDLARGEASTAETDGHSGNYDDDDHDDLELEDFTQRRGRNRSESFVNELEDQLFREKQDELMRKVHDTDEEQTAATTPAPSLGAQTDPRARYSGLGATASGGGGGGGGFGGGLASYDSMEDFEPQIKTQLSAKTLDIITNLEHTKYNARLKTSGSGLFPSPVVGMSAEEAEEESMLDTLPYRNSGGSSASRHAPGSQAQKGRRRKRPSMTGALPGSSSRRKLAASGASAGAVSLPTAPASGLPPLAPSSRGSAGPDTGTAHEIYSEDDTPTPGTGTPGNISGGEEEDGGTGGMLANAAEPDQRPDRGDMPETLPSAHATSESTAGQDNEQVSSQQNSSASPRSPAGQAAAAAAAGGQGPLPSSSSSSSSNASSSSAAPTTGIPRDSVAAANAESEAEAETSDTQTLADSDPVVTTATAPTVGPRGGDDDDAQEPKPAQALQPTNRQKSVESEQVTMTKGAPPSRKGGAGRLDRLRAAFSSFFPSICSGGIAPPSSASISSLDDRPRRLDSDLSQIEGLRSQLETSDPTDNTSNSGRVEGSSVSSADQQSLDRYDHYVKILLLGDSGVGKTSLMLRFADDQFQPNLMSTAGVDFKVRYLEDSVRTQNMRIKCQIWDTAGQERFHVITRTYYRGAHGIALVYDAANKQSFDQIKYWMDNIKTYAGPEACVVVFGNKVDLPSRVISPEQGRATAESYGARFYETSAKNGTNVLEAFEALSMDAVAAAASNDARSPKSARANAGGVNIDSGRASCLLM